MDVITCPNCHARYEIVPMDGPARATGSTIGGHEMRDVFQFISEHTPGRFTFASLYREYEMIPRVGMLLSKNGLAQALKAHGCIPYRTGRARGWEIPPIALEKPARPAPSVREAEERAAQRDFELSPPPRVETEDERYERQKREAAEAVAEGVPF